MADADISLDQPDRLRSCLFLRLPIILFMMTVFVVVTVLSAPFIRDCYSGKRDQLNCLGSVLPLFHKRNMINDTERLDASRTGSPRNITRVNSVSLSSNNNAMDAPSISNHSKDISPRNNHARDVPARNNHTKDIGSRNHQAIVVA